jgi:hypothetical protein
MDNLEGLAGESSAHDTHSEEGRRGRGRGRDEAPSPRSSEKQQAETRIITRRNGMQRQKILYYRRYCTIFVLL